jgi:DNA processing protein
MSTPVVRWMGLALWLARNPGMRRRILGESAGEPSGLAAALDRVPPGWEDAARAELECAARLGVDVLTIEAETYSPLLRRSADPPPILYVRGRLLPDDRLAVAVVGARRATPQGALLASGLASALAGRGLTVVSGLARGIDAAAHRGALEAGGRTVAVLGSGIDRIYPDEHRKLAETIARQGAVVSELPLGSAPFPQNFPERNRIIAWMSWATVVVEAARDSGSLITAGLAADAGRMVMAVPGPPGEPNAAGTNALLRDGAACCRGAEDVLEDLAPQIVETAAGIAAARSAAGGATLDAAAEAGPPGTAAGNAAAGNAPENAEMHRILDALPASRGLGVEELGAASGLPPGRLLALLLDLELAGEVRQLPGRRFLKTGLICRPI